MSNLPFTDQRGRLRRVVTSALQGTTYASSREEEAGRLLVIEADKPGGYRVVLRFRGVRSAESTGDPVVGSPLRLQSVGAPGNFFQRLVESSLQKRLAAESRVTIQAGAARLDIVCQDAEWWEEPGTAGGQ